MTTFIQRFESVIANDWAGLKTFFGGEVWPALENFFKNTLEEEVQTLIPILEKNLPAVVADVGAVFTPGGWAAAASGLVEIAVKALPELEAAGKSVAAESIHTAIGAVLSNAKAAYNPQAGQPSAPVAAQPGT